MIQTQVLIRHARASDRAGLEPWTQNTFRWGDYISDVFDAWLNDTNGKFLIAEIEGRVVGCVHVALLGDGEAWDEGMRVHPDFRRRGISTALDAAAREFARAAGYHVTRLATDEDNLITHKTLDAQGYSRLFKLAYWKSALGEGASGEAEVAQANDVPRLLDVWQASEERALCQDLAWVGQWHWATLDYARLAAQVAHEHVRWTENGLWQFDFDPDQCNYFVGCLAASANGLTNLLAEVLGDARFLQAREIEIGAHENSSLSKRAREWGFASNGGLYIYEVNLNQASAVENG